MQFKIKSAPLEDSAASQSALTIFFGGSANFSQQKLKRWPVLSWAQRSRLLLSPYKVVKTGRQVDVYLLSDFQERK